MEERRRFYRINDELSLSYRVIQASNAKQEMLKVRQQRQEFTDMRNTLHCLDARLDTLTDKIAKDHPLMAEIVTLMNRKLALYEHMLSIPDNDNNAMAPARQVNLSASGIAFTAETPIKEGTYIKLEMITYPDSHYIPAVGRVVSCRAENEGSSAGYNIAANFEAISQEDQDKIIYHIFRKQSAELRQQRQETSTLKKNSASEA